MTTLETQLRAFIYERQRIYIKKTAGDPWPWTDDVTLQRTKINNIFRRFDKFTVFESEAIADMGPAYQVRFIAMARYVFSQPFMEFLLSKNFIVTKKDLLEFKRSVGGGYNYINEVVQFYRPSKGSTERVLLSHLKRIALYSQRFVKVVPSCTTPESVLTLLHECFPQLGKFRLYEVYTSLTYLKWFPFNEHDLLVIGPGSRRMAKLLGLRTLSDFQMKAYEIDADLKRMKLNCGQDYTVRTLEDSLCEFRKYTIAKDRWAASGDRPIPVKVYKPAWFPVLAHQPKYTGPHYAMPAQIRFDGQLTTREKRFTVAILPRRVQTWIAALKHGRIYTKHDLVTIASTINGTGTWARPFFASMIQMGFFHTQTKAETR